MSMQKCSGLNCIHRHRCLHHLESKKKPTKGKWIDAEKCIQSEWDDDAPVEPVMIKPSFDKLLLKEQS